jgi:hypothetical protein
VAPVVLGVMAVGTGAEATFLLSAAVAAAGCAILVGREVAVRHPVET